MKRSLFVVIRTMDRLTSDPLNAKLCRIMLRFAAGYAVFQVIRGIIQQSLNL